MDNITKISNRDVVSAQKALWVLTGISVVTMVLFTLLDFSINLLWVTLGMFALNFYFHYTNFNFWNVWYENENIYVENLYRKHAFTIERFKKVETISAFRNVYGLFVDSNEMYPFRLSATEDFKLFFKLDEEHYAKRITGELLELKKNISDRARNDHSPS